MPTSNQGTSCAWSLHLLLISLQVINGDWLKLKGFNVGNQHTVQRNVKKKPFYQPMWYPGGRSSFASWIDPNQNMYMFGGFGFDHKPAESPRLLSDLWLFNASTATWGILDLGVDNKCDVDNLTDLNSSSHPMPRQGAAACGVMNEFMVIFGGEAQDNRKLNDTWLFYFATGTWCSLTALSPKHSQIHPFARSNMAHWCLPDKLLIYSGSGISTAVHDMWMFSLPKKYWLKINHDPTFLTKSAVYLTPLPRFGAGTWFHKDCLYMFGGATGTFNIDVYKISKNQLLSDLWCFNTTALSWIMLHENNTQFVQMSPLSAPNPRVFSMTWLAESHLLLYGGFGIPLSSARPDFLLDMWNYSVVFNEWQSVPVENYGQLEYEYEDYEKASEFFYVDNDYDDDNLAFQSFGLEYKLPTDRCCGKVWLFTNVSYMWGGLGYDEREIISYLNDMYVSSNHTEDLDRFFIIAEETFIDRLFNEIPPWLIFLICLSTTFTFVILMGLIIFVKKAANDSSHSTNSVKDFVKFQNVEYDALTAETE